MDAKQKKLLESTVQKKDLQNQSPSQQETDTVNSRLSSRQTSIDQSHDISDNQRKPIQKGPLKDEDQKQSKNTDQQKIKDYFASDVRQYPVNNRRADKKIDQNLLFYLGEYKMNDQAQQIDEILVKWKGDYNKLQRDHDYIQWLFPNHFQSRFNYNAQPLSQQQATLFRKNIVIANRIFKSYELITDFFGIEIENPETGKLKRSPDYVQRYYMTFLTSWHNHMRIRRILTCLSIVGFRNYSENLHEFLEIEMFGEVGGYDKYQKDSKKYDELVLNNVSLKIVTEPPLWQLRQYKIFDEWNYYQRLDAQSQTYQEDLEILIQNCQINKDQAHIFNEQSVFFNQQKN